MNKVNKCIASVSKTLSNDYADIIVLELACKQLVCDIRYVDRQAKTASIPAHVSAP